MSVNKKKEPLNNSPSGVGGMEYNFREIEKKWQLQWEYDGVYKVSNDSPAPKYYVLDMFPYPSGAGLHVGHPLGYIASDIYARYKRLKGFNVLHPMGYDAFGLPAEQYAIDHGIHPVVSTQDNINTFRSQLDNIGFSYDWSREVRTCDPKYYKWTQWIFLQIFDSWFNRKTQAAARMAILVDIFEKEGNSNHPFPNTRYELPSGKDVFYAEEWNSFDEITQREILMQYRLAYLAFTEVNWCEALGTVLANDEVVNGVSERGGFPVVRKKMRQWSLRITEFAERLLKGLEEIDFSESMKEIQRNWIGKSFGAEIDFPIHSPSVTDQHLKVFTTRPDTIFGVDFMVLAPEHELVKEITTTEHKLEIDEYLKYVQSRSEVERMAEVKKITGCFTGAYANHPFSGNQIPIWVSEYVLAGYGTGAIMGVPCGDERDHKFATHFGIPITNIIGDYYNGEEANPTKEAILQNSDFLDGKKMRDVIDEVIKKLEEKGFGKRQVNYKMRDAGWSRQRYWGEPFPIVYKKGIPYAMDEKDLPLELPPLDDFRSAGTGEGPLANVTDWVNLRDSEKRDTNTMPTHAGAAWYFLRYTDPHNDKVFADKKSLNYWRQVDVYIGGAEHAVAHLLYSRLWVKILHDLGYLNFDEPFKKLINQGKIQGKTAYIYRLGVADGQTGKNVHLALYISKDLIDEYYRKQGNEEDKIKWLDEICRSRIQWSFLDYSDQILNQEKKSDAIITPNDDDKLSGGWSKEKQRILFFDEIPIDIKYVDDVEVNIDQLKGWRTDLFNAEFIKKSDKFYCDRREEKMSKRYFNVVNPDELVIKYGADTFRMYEMFLGPLEASKPWDTKGIEGVHRFLKKLWRLFYDETKGKVWNEEKAAGAELKVLHKTIKQIEEATERFSFNTGVSGFMIAVNELTDLKCHKREILEPLLILLTPYAPHIAEELYQHLQSAAKAAPAGGGRERAGSILDATYPLYYPEYLIENSKEYPISINGKLRTTMDIALDAAQPEIEKMVLNNDVVQKWLGGKQPKKIIFVKGKMVNVVV